MRHSGIGKIVIDQFRKWFFGRRFYSDQKIRIDSVGESDSYQIAVFRVFSGNSVIISRRQISSCSVRIPFLYKPCAIGNRGLVRGIVFVFTGKPGNIFDCEWIGYFCQALRQFHGNLPDGFVGGLVHAHKGLFQRGRIIVNRYGRCALGISGSAGDPYAARIASCSLSDNRGIFGIIHHQDFVVDCISVNIRTS